MSETGSQAADTGGRGGPLDQVIRRGAEQVHQNHQDRSGEPGDGDALDRQECGRVA